MKVGGYSSEDAFEKLIEIWTVQCEIVDDEAVNDEL